MSASAHPSGIAHAVHRLAMASCGCAVVVGACLGPVAALQALTGNLLENTAYQWMFFSHLVLGGALLVFAVLHVLLRWLGKRTSRGFRWSFWVLVAGAASGYTLIFASADGLVGRTTLYTLHVVLPVFGVLWYAAGSHVVFRARVVLGVVTLLAVVLVSAVIVWPTAPVPEIAHQPFAPALTKTASGGLIDADALMRDEFCGDCHVDVHAQWQYSAHRFSSFNNPAYRFTVRNTRRKLLARDGNEQGVRLCAGCHDPVALVSGAFDDPFFDDEQHPSAHAGITCLTCHGIERLGSHRGNADYVLGVPRGYPFSESDSGLALAINRLLIRANPDLHKATLLRPLHRSAEFCGACHKVHLPEELNHYRWLRGQNHYDSFRLSGVSGHSVESFYYPEQAVRRCADCHMPLEISRDPAARLYAGEAQPSVRGHLFPAANTALGALLGLPERVRMAHEEHLADALRIDIFALRESASGKVVAPLRPELPVLEPGGNYIVEIVLRNLRVGHTFTEGTADSNQVWVEVVARDGTGVIGQSGALRAQDQLVDDEAHFVNAYLVDRAGRRIDRRNAEDTYVKLYDHQLPPGAADVVAYRLRVPEDVAGEVRIRARIRYRKFDARFLALFSDLSVRKLPIATIASDELVLPVRREPAASTPPGVAAWERWNDYGIGNLRKPGGRALGRARKAFLEVAALGRGEGHMNLARTHLAEGRLKEAEHALVRAQQEGAHAWWVVWFQGLVDYRRANLDDAIRAFRRILATDFDDARRRGFDFSMDERVHNQLALALLQRAGVSTHTRESDLVDARHHFERSLALDVEGSTVHYGLSMVHEYLGDEKLANIHRALYEKYREDDNAPGSAIRSARLLDPAANRAANALNVYELRAP
ncbi:MAG: multiheme c-type cytochrome [Pseudomonadales bacterium]|nr:multiheme c-type cytochrome [Pseudomonadales bacterium]MDP6472132.1 multiheme c-type cytochrome [Pseudomonadales bacterium]MDP6826616.1 multiheme c-type cytochrome [Pseudomonadales bacterium]MDP6970113.1 multiheme c-type cytochrome [Pseudomonadales bacterium]